ncbi:unnamed protein product [Prorocentrum cordatum]|uniref:Uncharacterized protein n=1 Tax=Prorocentrum cordatum TaxID=2364126 RepID=A0ABN9U1F2_9DINO|nr:unnamed protein product [Polarella glacialis]
MCFRPERVEPNWSYVGAGQGGYEKVETYNYVGEGAGSYDQDLCSPHVFYGWRLRSCCFCLLCSCGVFVLWWALGLFDHRWRDLAHWHLLLPGALPGSNTSSRTEGLGAGQDVLGSGTFPGNFTPGHLGIAGAPGAARNSSTECSAVGENCTSTKCCKD